VCRAGLASASRCRSSIFPTCEGTTKLPRPRPAPSSLMVNSTAASARASSAASTAASWHSPTSGATTSRIRFPICLSSPASWSRASASRTFSARHRVSSSTCDGRASTASTTTCACSVRSTPEDSAEATAGCASNARPNARSRRASRRVVRVRTASHAAASRSPCASPTSSAAASTRARRASSCDLAPASARSAASFSAVPMNTGSTPRTPFNAAEMSPAHSTIGCTGPPPRRTSRTPTPFPGWCGETCRTHCQVATREPHQRHPASTRTGSMDDCPDPQIPVASDEIRFGPACYALSYTCSNTRARLSPSNPL
jgi:hypothetical protein